MAPGPAAGSRLLLVLCTKDTALFPPGMRTQANYLEEEEKEDDEDDNCCFVALKKCVRVKINKRLFEPFCVWILKKGLTRKFAHVCIVK